MPFLNNEGLEQTMKFERLKIFHFILGKANKNRANGVNQVIAGLAKYSARHGAEVRIIGKAESVDVEGEIIYQDGFSVKVFSRDKSRLKKAVRLAIAWSDIVHLHGVFNPQNLCVSRLCNCLQKPYVVTLHGGLAPELLRSRSRIKKMIYHRLLQQRHLETAAGIHILAEEEATDVFSLLKPSHLFCIPNGIDLEDYPSNEIPAFFHKKELLIGYLGRISPEKNIDALCKAISMIRNEVNIHLKIAGPNSQYLNEILSTYCKDVVEWVGPQFGREKSDFIRSIDLFVHPSKTDVFSISAMEVLALGTPLLITRTSKSTYFFDRRAFFMCEPTAYGIERGLRIAIEKQSDWHEIAINGRKLIEERLNWSLAGKDLLQEYAYILNGDS